MIDRLRDVVNEHQAVELEWGDDKLLVDVQTANLLVTLYEALKEEANKSLLDLKLKESMKTFQQSVEFAWSKVR